METLHPRLEQYAYSKKSKQTVTSLSQYPNWTVYTFMSCPFVDVRVFFSLSHIFQEPLQLGF